jgi:hypothetical protein
VEIEDMLKWIKMLTLLFAITLVATPAMAQEADV